MTEQEEAISSKITISLWILFLLSFSSNVLGGSISTVMAVYLPEVVKDLTGTSGTDDISDVSAYINAIYILGWTFGGFIWGMISDRVGRVKSFIASFALMGLFTASIAVVNSWEMVVTMRLLTGFCVGGVLVITNTYLSEVWPVKSRSIFIGILSIGFAVGIISAGVINYLFHDWRTGFLFGIAPLSIALISIFFLSEENNMTGERPFGEHSSFKNLFTENRENLVKGSVIFGSMLIGLWAVFSWLPTWVQSLLEAGSDGQEQRSFSMMLIGMGGLTGGFISGWVASGLGLKKSMIICFTGCFITAIILFGFNQSFSGIIYFEIGILALFFGISQGLLATYIPQLFKHSIRGAATGFCFNTGRIFTAAAVFFIGAFVSIFGGYSTTLLFFSLVFLVGLITTVYSRDIAMIPETVRKNSRD